MDRRDTARSLAFYLATLCPVAVLLGVLIDSIERAHTGPLWGHLVRTAAFVIGFLGTATVGHIVAALLLPPVRSNLLASRIWAFPIACGIAYSLATVTGCVEQTTDLIGKMVGHSHEYAVVAGCAIAWSAAATVGVVGVDAVLGRLMRRL